MAILVCTGFAPGQRAEVWKAGAAKVVITPDKLMWMSGYGGRNKPAEGKLHDLWAKALVLEDPTGRRGVLVTMDLVGIDRDLAGAVCRELERKFGFPRAAIILSVSHTHTGPVVGSNLNVMYALDARQREYVEEYARTLRARLVQVVADAVKNLAPADPAWGVGRATFAVNRRNNKEDRVPQLIAEGKLKGPVDHDVPVLSVRDRRGRLKAVVFGYACHATVLSFYLWSGDYPGFAQIALEKSHPGAVALFWAGCGGDQNPLPRRKVALAEKYGQGLAHAVNAVLDGKAMKPVAGKFAQGLAEIDLPFAELPTKEDLERDAAGKDRYRAARARLLLESLRKQRALPRSYPYPVQVWRVGRDLDWVTLGGEAVVDYALRIKKEIGPATTWVMAYANDVMAYIPSLRVLREGGYEGGGAMVYYGLPSVWGPQVEERILTAVHDQVRALRQHGE
jgi:hypothetical protein